MRRRILQFLKPIALHGSHFDVIHFGCSPHPPSGHLLPTGAKVESDALLGQPAVAPGGSLWEGNGSRRAVFFELGATGLASVSFSLAPVLRGEGRNSVRHEICATPLDRIGAVKVAWR